MSSAATGGRAVATAPPPAAGAAVAPAGSALVPTTVPAPPAAAAPRLPLSADVPTALARWQAVLAIAVVAWAVLTAAILGNSFDKTRTGAEHTGQLIRVHEIESNLFLADAIATNAFLVGGLEPPEQQAAYDAALERVTSLIVEAAEAQPADRAVLEALNHDVLRYAEQMQQARANNRQGLPVGAQYLREASAQLRSDTLPLLDNLITYNEQRADGSLTGHTWVLVVLPGLVLLLLLGWFNQQLAAIFHRRLNLGLVGAAVLVAAATIGAGVVIGSLGSDARGLREGAFATATSLSSARTAAGDARSHESLRLIARGSGAQFEEGWIEASNRVLTEIEGDRDLENLWEQYTAAHEEIVAADEAGDWDEAVALATATGEGSASAALRAFDERTSAATADASRTVADALGRGSWQVAIAAVATILAAAIATVAVSWGITQRRREFS
ncbi:MAG: hypothetical protein GXY39_00215 [Actinomycetales bacterium]|nr:hypothetical protein [Actinomycetales bacterium]